MMLRVIPFVAVAALIAGSGIASANPVNQRQRHQAGRIHQGARSGELTRGETRGLIRQQRHIAAEEARYRRSGNGLSIRERADLQRDLARASRNIYRQKHDRQDR